VVQKPAIADPTQALFAAINSGDYNAAQDALSRGADLTAKNSLGETPLDLSIALNHNSITFLLLATRNETAGSATGTSASGPALPVAAPTISTPTVSARAKPRPAVRPPAPAVQLTPGNNPGTPDPSAGFLGFAPKS
jgi:ankyrin repeat protein